MNLSALDIPESPAELAWWLEDQVVGLHLLETVAVLEAFRAKPPRGTQPPMESKLSAVLDGRLAAVLAQGLRVLSATELRQLLTQPRLLLELQELVLRDGGEAWFSRPVTAEHRQLVDEGWQQLHGALGIAPETVAQTRPASTAKNARAIATPAPVTRRWLLAGMTVAAALAFSIFLLAQPQAWGWDTPGALAVNLEPKPYLQHLAGLAEQYYQQPRDSRTQLEVTLRAFRHSCDTLIAAPHMQLPPDKRTLLKQLCRQWAAKLDVHLAELEGTGDVVKIRGEADQTIRGLVQRLQDEAAGVG